MIVMIHEVCENAPETQTYCIDSNKIKDPAIKAKVEFMADDDWITVREQDDIMCASCKCPYKTINVEIG